MFNITCSNKGCGQNSEALLDEASGEVLCRYCNRAISNITSFAKVQLKSMGQTTSKIKVQRGFSTKCPSCLKETMPLLQKVGLREELVCRNCQIPLTNLTSSFRQLVLEKLRSN